MEPKLVPCHNCGLPVTPEVDAAYNALYGPWAHDLRQLEHKLYEATHRFPNWSDEEIFTAVFEDLANFQPADLVKAVRHRLQEEEVA